MQSIQSNFVLLHNRVYGLMTIENFGGIGMKLNDIIQGGIYKVDAVISKDEHLLKYFLKNIFTLSFYLYLETATTGGVQTFVLKKDYTCEIYKGNLKGNHTLVDSFDISPEDFKNLIFEKRKLRRNGYKYKFIKSTFVELEG